MRTARRKAAGARHLRQWRHLSGNRLQPAATPRQIGQCGEQHLRIGMARRREKGRAWRLLDDLPRIHHAHPGGHLRDDAQVVGDQQHARRALALQAPQKFQNLRLDGDVEGGRRFVGNQQTRIAGQRDGDHHPLFHAAGKLEGIFAEPPFRIGQSHCRQQFERTRAHRLPGQAEVPFEHFGKLPTDGEHRIEAGRRLLKDHRHAATAHGAHLGFRQAQKIAAGETHFAAEHPPGCRQQAEQAQRRRRLAATGLAEQRQRLAGGDLETDPVDRREQRTPAGKSDPQIADVEQHGFSLPVHADPTRRGSKASRTASANRFAARTRMNMKTKAAASDHHTIGSRASSMRALLIIVPKLIIVGSTPMPT
jgi:hypothetical protein